MKVLYNWLKEFVDVKAPAADLRTRLSLAGVAIDSLEESPAGPVLDAEITANRPDCLGHFGIAREVAAIYRLPVKPLHPQLKESTEKASDATRIPKSNHPIFAAATPRGILRNVKVQPSPDWLRQRLEAIGQNSINNVVDITNYVLFELGQPMHAFDLDKLAEHRIVVRRARPGEKIRTLDGAERTLAKDMCVNRGRISRSWQLQASWAAPTAKSDLAVAIFCSNPRGSIPSRFVALQKHSAYAPKRLTVLSAVQTPRWRSLLLGAQRN